MRRAAIVCAYFASILALTLSGLMGQSYYRRWQASKLLDVVRELHPGATTESQTRELLKPFANYQRVSDQDNEPRNMIQYDFRNLAKWNPIHFVLPWTLFTVTIEFVNGQVARILAIEMQEDQPGYPHPNAVNVTNRSSILLPSRRPGFTGYSEYAQSTGSVDDQGRWTGFECCHDRFIELDERATSVQISKSLNFRLSCMTSFVRCKDDRQILP